MAREVSEGRLRTDADVALSSLRERRPKPNGVRCVAEYCVGASLRAWAELFPNATVTGLDPADDAAALNGLHERIRVITCDSRDDLGVAKLGSYDFIVDDGHHSLDAQRSTLKTLWPFVKPGGLYVIEDVADWGERLVADRAYLSEIVGAGDAAPLPHRARSQTATSSWPGVPKMGAFVFRGSQCAMSLRCYEQVPSHVALHAQIVVEVEQVAQPLPTGGSVYHNRATAANTTRRRS